MAARRVDPANARPRISLIQGSTKVSWATPINFLRPAEQGLQLARQVGRDCTLEMKNATSVH